jgi:hypothetical protein
MRDGLPEQQPVLRSCVLSLLKSSSNARNVEAHARSGTAMQFADARQQDCAIRRCRGKLARKGAAEMRQRDD